MKNFRKCALLGLLALVALFVAACNSDDGGTADTGTTAAPTTTAPAATTTAPTAEAPTEAAPADTRLLGYNGIPLRREILATFTTDADILNPVIAAGQQNMGPLGITLTTLTMTNPFGESVPGLAESWSVSADGLTWTFNLRQGVYWRNYRFEPIHELTAHDFVFVATYMLDPGVASTQAHNWHTNIAGAREYFEARQGGGSGDFSTVGIRAVDNHTLEYTTVTPNPFFPAVVAAMMWLPIPQEFVEDIGFENYGTSNTNTLFYGEFIMTVWDRDQRIVYERNPYYWYAHRIHVDRRESIMVAEPMVAQEMFWRGETTGLGINAAMFDEVMANPELEPFVTRGDLGTTSWAWHFNFRGPSTDFQTAIRNQNFRLAMQWAMDVVPMISVEVLQDPEFIIRNSFNQWGIAFDENGRDYMTFGNMAQLYNERRFDTERAMAYLALAKEELGDTVSWPIAARAPFNTGSVQTMQGELLRAIYLENLQGYVIIEPYSFEQANLVAMRNDGNWDMHRNGWMPSNPDPVTMLGIWAPDGNWGSMWDFDTIPELVEFGEMVDRARNAATLTQRFEILAEAEWFIYEQGLLFGDRASGGGFGIGTQINPFHNYGRNALGISNHFWLDRMFGYEWITREEHDRQRAEFNALVASR